ncbi:MAG: UvrD-helicase domain-containing protein, partial [Oscillospiraceae bacterium]|nr:UvrD-helicase domain-containing protein [Oscillospiraceae bacterium]
KKKEMGVLGFDDLEHCALNILSVKENGKLRPSDFALEYGGRIREIMVDEYQDTNGIQDDIFECLSAGGAELFVVGDVKQSIYRFRSAEPDIFLRRRNEGVLVENIPLGAGDTRLSKENNTVIMQRNFRSLPEVTDTVNSVFRKLMVRDFAEMDYLPGDELVACRDGGDESNTAELVFIKGERSEDDEDGGQSSSAREREAAWIAKRVSSMLSGGVTVFDKSVGGKRLLRPGDIAVLVRSAKRRVSVLAEAFAAEGIPVSADAGGDIFGSAEVNAVMSMLSAVDNPGRELALAGYLRSPLVGFSAEELGRIKICSGGSFYASLKLCAEGVGETAEKCRSVLKELEKMRLAASDLDVGRAVGMLLDMSGAYVVFGSMDGGITRRANLNLIVGFASSYSERGGRDLGGFVRSLERSRDHGDEFPAPKVAGDGVRIMTVHASKGLEFPVVFLANSMEKANISWKRENVMVHKDCGLGMLYSDAGSFVRHTTLPREAAAIRISEQQLAEELRLLYVAMTRAREKLIVTGSCDDLDALAAEVRNDGSESWIKGICSRKPSFGRWLFAVANCGEEIPLNVCFEDAVKTSADGENKAEETAGEVDAELCEKIEKRTGFVYPHMSSASLPAKMTATGCNGLVELASESLSVEKDIPLPSFMNRSGELNAAERGIAVHLAMQLIPQKKYADEREAEAELGLLESRGVLNSRQRSVISARGIKAFYDSEIGFSVLEKTNREVRREFKFSVLCPAEKFLGPDGAGEELLLQGVIDLFWIGEDGDVCIADYKTDNIFPGMEKNRAESYRSQLEVYKYALEEILQKPVKKAYIWFFKTEKAVCIDF